MSNTRLKQIEEEIQDINVRLKMLKGTPTEVYTRIVGYHRAIDNWNKGKREEYKHRKAFSKLESKNTEIKSIEEIKKEKLNITKNMNYILFTSDTCRNCPPVKDYMKRMTIKGEEINVNTDEGLELATKFEVRSTPYVLFFEDLNNILYRATSVKEIKEGLNV